MGSWTRPIGERPPISAFMSPRVCISSALFALCCLFVALPAHAEPGGDGVRVELTRGRGLLVTENGVQPIGRLSGPIPIRDPGHLELAPGSHATLAFPSVGSLRLEGPTSVAWQQPTSEGEQRLTFSALYAAEVELRAGSARLDLPGAWRVHLSPGAVSLHGLPGGGCEVVNHAGQAVRAQWIGSLDHVAPAQPIAPGECGRLQGSHRPEWHADPSGSAPRWTETAWPWGDGGIENAPDMALDPVRPWNPGTWPWGSAPEDAAESQEPWTRWDWPWVPAPAPIAAASESNTRVDSGHPRAREERLEAPDAPVSIEPRFEQADESPMAEELRTEASEQQEAEQQEAEQPEAEQPDSEPFEPEGIVSPSVDVATPIDSQPIVPTVETPPTPDAHREFALSLPQPEAEVARAPGDEREAPPEPRENR